MKNIKLFYTGVGVICLIIIGLSIISQKVNEEKTEALVSEVKKQQPLYF